MVVLKIFDNDTPDSMVRNRVYREEFYWVESATEGKCIGVQLHDIVFAIVKRSLWK